MKQVVVLSGKGGTGKTTLTASLCRLLPGITAADCDVDAANLMLLSPGYQALEIHDFPGGRKAWIRRDVCTSCGTCRAVCRFDAITSRDRTYTVDPYSCEGCGACALVCPANAVVLTRTTAGRYTYGETVFFGMAGGDLFPGEEMSGGLVTRVKELAINKADIKASRMVLADGAPGIACPAISSLSGAHYAVLVAEPGVSGLHDLTRALELVRSMNTRSGVVVNKHDILPDITARIRVVCLENGNDFLGTIPFDPAVAEAARRGVPIVEYPGSPASQAVIRIAAELEKILTEINKEASDGHDRNTSAGKKPAVKNQ